MDDLFFSQAEEEEKRRRKNGTTFQVGSLAVRNDIFDELLNERKLELLLDPGREMWIYNTIFNSIYFQDRRCMYNNNISIYEIQLC